MEADVGIVTDNDAATVDGAAAAGGAVEMTDRDEDKEVEGMVWGGGMEGLAAASDKAEAGIGGRSDR